MSVSTSDEGLCCHAVFLQILFGGSKLAENVSVHSAWLSSVGLKHCLQFLTLRKGKKRKGSAFLSVRKHGSYREKQHFFHIFLCRILCLCFVCMFTYMCLCVSINFPRYMQKERRSLAVMCRGFLCLELG